MKVDRTVQIDAPPDRVYDVLMDPDRLKDWVTIHVGLKNRPKGDLTRGAEMTQCLKLAGKRFDVSWKVSEADRPSRVAWVGRGPVRTRASALYRLAPADGGGTRFDYCNEFDLPGGPLGRMVGSGLSARAGRETDRSLAKLKALLER